jgi:PqqD family protein of HPr-rel-A system
MVPNLKWRLTSEAGLRWQHWQDRSLVFNPASGDTHLLDLPARTGLACLEAGPQSGEEMCRQMVVQLELEPETDLQPYVAKLLGRFRELGLVERDPA